MFIYFCLFLSFRSKVCGIRSFFECIIFSCEDVRESYRSAVHITSCYLIVLCVYTVNSHGFTFFVYICCIHWHPFKGHILHLMSLRLPSKSTLQAPIVFWCSELPSTKLTLLYLRVNLVHIGITAHQLFMHQGSW